MLLKFMLSKSLTNLLLISVRQESPVAKKEGLCNQLEAVDYAICKLFRLGFRLNIVGKTESGMKKNEY